MVFREKIWQRQFPGESGQQIRDFASRIDDQNPIHHSDTFAKNVGLDMIVATGVRIMGFVSSTIGNELPGAMIRRIEDIKFPKPLYPGVPVVVRCSVVHFRYPIAKVKAEVIIGSGNVGECICTLAFLKRN
jgi:acyl dehydratase